MTYHLLSFRTHTHTHTKYKKETNTDNLYIEQDTRVEPTNWNIPSKISIYGRPSFKMFSFTFQEFRILAILLSILSCYIILFFF